MKRDGSWHAIRVKVNAPGAHVRYRNGYYAPRDFQHLEKEDREKQLADAMRSERPGSRSADRRRNLDVPLERSAGVRSHLREAFFQRARLGAEARPPRGRIRFCRRGSRRALGTKRRAVARHDHGASRRAAISAGEPQQPGVSGRRGARARRVPAEIPRARK